MGSARTSKRQMWVHILVHAGLGDKPVFIYLFIYFLALDIT